MSVTALILLIAGGSIYLWFGADGFPFVSARTTIGAVGESDTTTSIEGDEAVRARPAGIVPDWSVGRPWGSTEGLTMFRGNPTRTFYGSGPVPFEPEIAWRYPETPLCGRSTVAGQTTTWCGTGWTGQPAIWVRPDGVTELIVGTYDHSVHFLDANTGEPTRPPFPTGDIIKGSVTIDPDGYPLLYFGSRDNKLRIVALDRELPELLWFVDADDYPGIWNNDWDSNPVLVDDVLFEGGENGWIYAIKLNRQFADDGLVAVEPDVVIAQPGYNNELLQRVGQNVSIENSVAAFEDRIYFSNSGGRVVGLDVSNVLAGEAPEVFDYWVGDDVDATIVIDSDGMLYVSAELERFNARSAELGQLMKLNPYAQGDPFVWGIPVPPRDGGDGGIWATPALFGEMLYASTHPGQLLAVDTTDGSVLWTDELGWHAWSSPTVVDNTLVVATCTGRLRAYELEDPRSPSVLWETMIPTQACIESTPAIWDGRIYVGSRDGYLYAFGP